MESVWFLAMVVLNPAVAPPDTEFTTSGGSNVLRCPARGSCHQLCNVTKPCSGYRFECDSNARSCDVLCVGADVCANTTFAMSAAQSSVRVIVVVIVLSVALLCAVLGMVLLCGHFECTRRRSPNPSYNRLGAESGSSGSGSETHKAAWTPTLELNLMRQESSYFAHSFMLTLIQHLFGEQSKRSTLNCGILLVPEQRPVEHLLRALKIDDSRMCKAPVTHELLCHYGSAHIGCLRKRALAQTHSARDSGRDSETDDSGDESSESGEEKEWEDENELWRIEDALSKKYLVMQSGYIYAHDVYASDLLEAGEDMVMLARRHGFVVIDCEQQQTKDKLQWYLRTRVMGERVRSSEQFVSELEKYGIAVQMGEDEDERTPSWTASPSFESPQSFEDERTYEDSSALVRAVEHLQMQRTAIEHAEDLGATIVVIPGDKDMSHYNAFVRQCLSVSMEVNGDTLLSIFKHESVLHDGAIFVRGDRIIAVKAFFRLTGNSDTVSIGHGTRHASAKRFSKHAFEHRTIVLVLSEEDGQLRSCVDGQLHKISTDNIGKLVAEQQHCHTDSRRKPFAITDVCVHKATSEHFE